MIYLIPLTSTVILSTGFSGILIFQYQDTHQLNLTTTSLSITWHQGKIFSGSITNAPRLQQFCILSSSWWRKNMTYFPSNHLSLVKRHCSSNKRRERWFSLLEFHRSHCRLAVVNFGTIIQGQQKTDNSGGGGIYVLRDSEFLSKSIVFTVCEHKYMNMPPPSPIIDLRQCYHALPCRWINQIFIISMHDYIDVLNAGLNVVLNLVFTSQCKFLNVNCLRQHSILEHQFVNWHIWIVIFVFWRGHYVLYNVGLCFQFNYF